MKFFSKLISILAVLLLLIIRQGQAQDFEFDSLGVEARKKQNIILIDVIQPLLFGRVGVGFGIRSITHEYVFYGNYVFGKKLLPTTAFKVEN